MIDVFDGIPEEDRAAISEMYAKWGIYRWLGGDGQHVKTMIQSDDYYQHCLDAWLFHGCDDDFHSCYVGTFGVLKPMAQDLGIPLHDLDGKAWFYFSDLHKALEVLQ